MRRIALELRWSRLIAAPVVGLVCIAAAWTETPGQNSHPGRVVGYIDGIRIERDGYYVFGWA